MPDTKVVSIRVPISLLEAVDNLAEAKYPSRTGGTPNRSQLILDAIEAYINRASGNVDNSADTDNSTLIKTLNNVVERLALVENRVEEVEIGLGEFAA